MAEGYQSDGRFGYDGRSMFESACTLLDWALRGDVRQQVVAALSRTRDFRTALLRLRDSMRSNIWKAGGTEINLGKIVRKFDAATRAEGFHVLHDWDGIADKVNEDTIPIDVLHYIAEQRGGGPTDGAVLAILLDYYFMHLLALLSVRVWDDGDANGNMDRVDELLRRLQGSDGSGQLFAADAATLLLIATSHFELHEAGYAKLLVKTRTLNARHRLRIARGHAASMGSHLRFGFEATYARDTVVMRDDNAADYPWLSFALSTLIAEYTRRCAQQSDATGCEVLAEAMLNGL